MPEKTADFDRAIATLNEIHLQDGNNLGGKQAYKWAVGELTDNIYQHSQFKRAYVMGQSYKKRQYTEICITDDGVSIPGKFKEHRIAYESDDEAIKKAIMGTSTKEDGEEGTGLGASLNLIVNGLKGEVLLFSGSGGYYFKPHSKPIAYVSAINNYHTYSGTFVAFRIPYTEEIISIYPFVETRIEV